MQLLTLVQLWFRSQGPLAGLYALALMFGLLLFVVWAIEHFSPDAIANRRSVYRAVNAGIEQAMRRGWRTWR